MKPDPNWDFFIDKADKEALWAREGVVVGIGDFALDGDWRGDFAIVQGGVDVLE